MAYSVRIEAMKFPDTSPMLRLEPPWWDSEILHKDPRFKDIDETPGYWDCQAKLSIAEFKELSDRFSKHLHEGIFSCEEWKKHTLPMQAMMDGAIEYLNDDADYFLVTVFEWSSGY